MKVNKIISKSRGSRRMEVIAADDKGQYHTLHIHRHQIDWQYCVGLDRKGKIILKVIDMGGEK